MFFFDREKSFTSLKKLGIFDRKKELYVTPKKATCFFFDRKKELFTHEFFFQVMPYMGFNTQAVVTSRARLGLSKS